MHPIADSSPEQIWRWPFSISACSDNSRVVHGIARQSFSTPVRMVLLPHQPKANRPANLNGCGPDRISCSVACVSPLVSQTRRQQPRNGRTTFPDTAIAQLKASGQFLANGGTGNEHTLIDEPRDSTGALAWVGHWRANRQRRESTQARRQCRLH